MTLTTYWPEGYVVMDRYRVDRCLRVTRHCELYSAQDLRTTTHLELMRLLPDSSDEPALTQRVFLAGAIGRRLIHANIRRFEASGRDRGDGSLFIAREFLRGESLRSLLARQHRWSLLECLGIVMPIIGALAVMHRDGLVHRNITPECLTIEGDDSGRSIPKLMDLGAWTALGLDCQPKLHNVMSMLGYASPEQLLGSTELDPRADIWSIAVVLYEMLTGRHPFLATTPSAVIDGILRRHPPILSSMAPGCPESLASLIDAALSKDPRNRPSSMTHFVGELMRSSREECEESPTSLGCGQRPLGTSAVDIGAGQA